MEQLEAWINIREPVMKEKNVGENIQAVEELLRRQDDFEKTVDAQSEKFNAICRRTQVSSLYHLIQIHFFWVMFFLAVLHV